MSLACEFCCPTARQEKKGRSPRKTKQKQADEARDFGGKGLKTFMVPDSQDDDGDADNMDAECRRKEDEETSCHYARKGEEASSREGGEPAADEDDRKKVLKDLKKIAKRIEGPIQKHPSTGKALFRKTQDRYIAVVPDHELDVGELTRWKAGSLSWWESADACRTGSAAPKGTVPLLKIAKVDISKDDKHGLSVVVKHKHNQQMHELVLVFPTNRDAEEWSYALWEFISLVRGQSTAVYSLSS